MPRLVERAESNVHTRRGATSLILALLCVSCGQQETTPPSHNQDVIRVTDGRSPVVRPSGCVAGPKDDPFQITYEARKAADWQKPQKDVFYVKVHIDECDLLYTLSGRDGVPFIDAVARCDSGDVACVELPTAQRVAVYRDARVFKYPASKSFRTIFDEPVSYLGSNGKCEIYSIRGSHESLSRNTLQQYTYCPDRGVTEVVELDAKGKPDTVFRLISKYGLLSHARSEGLNLYGHD